ncbi:MAG: Multidrug resistance protein Stp [Planctomycetes bacterium]|nr:Multidrug resistance protein Stp [Planctomycetota bacterium]
MVRQPSAKLGAEKQVQLESVEKKGLSPVSLTGMMLAAALAPLGSTMIAVALPAIGHDVGASDAELTQWLVSSYMIAAIALQSPGGTLGDRIGHRSAMLLGLLLVGVAGVVGYSIVDLHALALARVLMAAGGAAIIPACMAMVRTRIDPKRRARWFGYFGAGMGLAAAIGPLVGGELTQAFGWRSLFAAVLPVVLISLLTLPFFGRDTRPANAPPPARFDLVGSVLLGVGLAAVIIALRMGERGLWLAAGGGVMLALFPFWERRAASPVVDFRLFRSPAFAAGGLIIALQNLAMYALLFQTPIFFKQVRHVESREMGHTLLAMTLAMMIASILGGRLSEKLGARLQVALGSVLALGGLWWFRDFVSIQTPTDILPGLVLMGTGLGLSSAPSQAAAMAAARPESAGMAAGALSTMRYIGGVIGIALLGAQIADAKDIGAHQSTVFVYAASLCIALLMAALLPRAADTRTKSN